MADEKHINLAPELTPAQLKANDELQTELRARFALPSAPQTSDDFARRVIADNLQILAQLNTQIQENRGDVNGDVTEYLKKQMQLRNDTALWLSTIGKFKEARKLASTYDQQNLYRLYSLAERRNGTMWCKHPRWKVSGTSGNHIPNYLIEFEYQSETLGKRVSMVKCGECHFRNAMDAPEDLMKLRALRHNLREVQKGESIRDDAANVKNHKQVIIKAGHINLFESIKQT